MHTGRDAHAHVGTCPEGQASIKVAKKQKGVGGRALGGMPATVYGTKEAFDVAQHRRRCKHLALYFEKFDEDGQRELLAALVCAVALSCMAFASFFCHFRTSFSPM